MDYQQVGVWLALAAAVAYIGRAVEKTWFGPASGCGSGCGKCAAPAAPTPEQGRRIRLL